MYENANKLSAPSTQGPVLTEIAKHSDIGRAIHEQIDRLEKMIDPILVAVPSAAEAAGVNAAHKCDLHASLIDNGNVLHAAFMRISALGDRVRL